MQSPFSGTTDRTALRPTPAHRTAKLAPTADRDVPDVRQYSRPAVLAVWAAAAVPMALLAWVVVPAVAGSNTTPAHFAVTLLTAMTIGLIWQAMLVGVLVARERRDVLDAVAARSAMAAIPRGRQAAAAVGCGGGSRSTASPLRPWTCCRSARRSPTTATSASSSARRKAIRPSITPGACTRWSPWSCCSTQCSVRNSCSGTTAAAHQQRRSAAPTASIKSLLFASTTCTNPGHPERHHHRLPVRPPHPQASQFLDGNRNPFPRSGLLPHHPAPHRDVLPRPVLHRFVSKARNPALRLSAGGCGDVEDARGLVLLAGDPAVPSPAIGHGPMIRALGGHIWMLADG